MLTFLTRTLRQEPLAVLAEDWGRPLHGRYRLVEYAALPTLARVEPGAYVFTGVDELTGAEFEVARRFADRLRAAGPAFAVLNDPSRALGRYELAAALHAAGVNPQRTLRLDEPLDGLRYPVFLRLERYHTGDLGGLLHNADELRRAIRKFRWRPRRFAMRDLVVCEFLDTRSADGLYRKYGVTRIGDRMVPRHVLFGEHWLVKYSDRSSAELAAEERAFLETFPHHEQVHAAFEIAGMEYGRIDYSLHEGRVVVWEINSNPMMGIPLERFDDWRRPAQTAVTEQMHAALLELAEPTDGAAALTGVFGPGDRWCTTATRLRAGVRRGVVGGYRRYLRARRG